MLALIFLYRRPGYNVGNAHWTTLDMASVFGSLLSALKAKVKAKANEMVNICLYENLKDLRPYTAV